MLKNFGLMPKPLKWVTSLGLTTLLLPVAMMISAKGTAEWWSTGAGWIAVCSLAPVPVAAVLMLQRRRIGAWLFLVGWITANASAPLIARARGGPTAISIPSAVFTLVVLAGLTALLLRSKDVEEYFRGPLARRDVPEVGNRDAPQ
jgi:hypothetical protein